MDIVGKYFSKFVINNPKWLVTEDCMEGVILTSLSFSDFLRNSAKFGNIQTSLVNIKLPVLTFFRIATNLSEGLNKSSSVPCNPVFKLLNASKMSTT